MGNRQKDRWDKADVLLKPVGGMVAALALALIGFFGSSYLEHRQDAEMRVRLYTELISRREQAESDLRKDMFTTVIQNFLEGESGLLDAQVFQLELLAYNFHESLNLKPLFTHVKNRIEKESKDGATRQQYQKRLAKVAREITRKQIAALETAARSFQRTVVFDELRKTPEGLSLGVAKREIDNVKRHFKTTVLEVDPNKQEVKIRLEIKSPEESNKTLDVKAEFWVGFFDFPMIDNTRLSHDQRCAIVLNAFGKSSADITGVYFPGAHASLREKPYYREMVQQLCPANYKKE